MNFVAAHLDLILFVSTIALMMFGFPVAFTLAGSALAFAWLGSELEVFRWAQLNFVPQRVWAILTNSVLVAAPLFIFMGLVLERFRLAEDMLTVMARLFGQRPGGLLVATTVVGALMAASTGIIGATVVTMGLLALPVMLKHGYSAPVACGAICATGTLGQIIPPSIVLIFLGDFMTLANQQANLASGNTTGRTVGVSDLFAGALLPGLGLVGLYLVYQLWITYRHPEKAPPIPRREAAAEGSGAARESDLQLLLRAVVAPLFLIVAVLGSILGGVATPTEASGIGAVGALLLAAWKQAPGLRHLLAAGLVSAFAVVLMLSAFDMRIGRLEMSAYEKGAIIVAAVLLLITAAAIVASLIVTWRSGALMEVTFSSGRITAMIFTVLVGATLFTLVFRGLGGEETIKHFLEQLPGGLLGAMLFTMALIFVLGFFLDFLEIIFILVPILCPILIVMGADPVWLSVMIAMNLQTSFLTPPFGFALFYLRSAAPASVSTMQIWRGAMPYIGLQVLALVALAFVPSLATWLPSLMAR
ncbi:TRAP transporter large permease [Microbaculum sp. FT89]|uniref:TRAP transporter large permease n=1 Tax=Microbaculum sp. FT89 TaxID=3447298 RepID=UPI003F52DB3E